MLVYTSESHKPSSIEIELSDKLQDYVDTENKAFVETCEEIISGKVFYSQTLFVALIQTDHQNPVSNCSPDHR